MDKQTRRKWNGTPRRRSVRVVELSDSRIVIRAGTRGQRIKSRELVNSRTRPVFKWAGGKQWLAGAGPHLLPKNFSGRYYEPFFGGGAMFFAIKPSLATLSDSNESLILTYDALRSDTEGVIRLLSTYPHTKRFFYSIRERSPRSPRRLAAQFLYLNRTCWNGLYRVNRDGKFNTPFGRFQNPSICDRDRLRSAAQVLRRVQLRAGDFEEATSKAKLGDFAYFDPPYITGHRHNGFLKYNASLFSWTDQQRLAQYVRKLADSGVHVLVSNADHPKVVGLYKGLYYYRVARRSAIGSKVSSRGRVVEALLSSYPLLGCKSEII